MLFSPGRNMVWKKCTNKNILDVPSTLDTEPLADELQRPDDHLRRDARDRPGLPPLHLPPPIFKPGLKHLRGLCQVNFPSILQFQSLKKFV